MTFISLPLIANLVMAILSSAMLVQSVRLLRSFRQIRTSGLADVVSALDRSTSEARTVLTELRITLSTEMGANQKTVTEAMALRDELAMMTEMGNATAERILTSVQASRILAVAEAAQKEAATSTAITVTAPTPSAAASPVPGLGPTPRPWTSVSAKTIS